MKNMIFFMTLKFNLNELEVYLDDGFRCNLNF
jgi:hypothetical protein